VYARRESGLGLAPVIAAAAFSLGAKLAGALFGPSEGDTMEAESKTGNVVAWWRLKAMVDSQLPAQGTINGRPFKARKLTAEEREALSATLGPEALHEDTGGGLFDSPTRNRVFRLYADDTGDWLDGKSLTLLHPTTTAGAFLGGSAPKWILAGVVGWIVFDLFRR
jgi:hypothetical protein